MKAWLLISVIYLNANGQFIAEAVVNDTFATQAECENVRAMAAQMWHHSDQRKRGTEMHPLCVPAPK